MKLLIDMNLSPRWVTALADRGIGATHWKDLGPGDAPDPDLFQAARDRNEVLLTNDLGFSAIHRQIKEKRPSVIQIRARDLSPEACADRLVLVLQKYGEELSQGAVVTLESRRERVRILPL